MIPDNLKKSKLILFGAGQNGKAMLNVLIGKGVTPAYIVDNNRANTSVVASENKNFSVFAPEVLLSEDIRNLKIVITPDEPNSTEVDLQIKNMGLGDCIYHPDNAFHGLVVQEKRNKKIGKIPITKLRHKNFENLKYVLDRQELLSLLPKSGICAEIGVADGSFAKDIVRITSPRKLHLIDAWDSERYCEQMMRSVISTFSVQIESGSISIDRGDSTVVLQAFCDNYFDWVYIDTDHSYEVTRRELELCNQKVKPSGIIAGHDFCMGNWAKGLKYGVIEAVYDFCAKKSWELIYITSDISCPSFALKRVL
jgi:hypothetical protein